LTSGSSWSGYLPRCRRSWWSEWGTELQRLPSSGTGGQPLARFDLAKLADTVRAHGFANLELALDELRFPLATCAPRRLADAVIVDDEGRLKLVNAAAADGLAAACYQVYAPWREPVALPIGPDHTSEPLPDHIRVAGPLVVQLRVEDPWLPTPWPDWPDRESAFALADRPWSLAPLDDVEAELSGFLAGVLSLPNRPEVASLALRLYRRADELRRLGVERDVRDAAASMLAAHPAAALAAVLDARMSGAGVVAPLVHAGLASAPPVRP
jgi:hypothetical protein